MLDNQMLLLLVLGIAIYYLTRPDNTPEPANKNEKPVQKPIVGNMKDKNLASVENFEEHSDAKPEPKPEAKPEAKPEVKPEAKPVAKPDIAEQVVEEAEKKGFMPIANDANLAAVGNVGQPLHAKGVNPNVIPERKSTGGHSSKDFLPNEKKDNWFQSANTLALDDSALITVKAGHHIGVNTVGQSLRNASYDLRGTIPNPKKVISPWMNSTIMPDNNLQSLCN